MRNILATLVLVTLMSAAALSQTPRAYGPGNGFEQDKDLGPCPTKAVLMQKLEEHPDWMERKLRTLFSRHPRLAREDPKAWAEAVMKYIKTGQFASVPITIGTVLQDVSGGSGKWTGRVVWQPAEGFPKAPLGSWDISVYDAHTGMALMIVIAKGCGNLVYIDYVRVEVPKPVEPPPVSYLPQGEVGQDKVPPTNYVWGQRTNPSGAKSIVNNPRAIMPVSSLPKPTRVNVSQISNQAVNLPKRKFSVAAGATGGSGFGQGSGFGHGAGAGSSSSSASGVQVGGSGGGGAGGQAMSTGASSAAGGEGQGGGGGQGGGQGGNTWVIVEGEY